MNPQDVSDAIKRALDSVGGVEVYAYVPPAPVLPAIMVGPPERIDYTVTNPSTFVVWLVTGEVESQGAQAQMNAWLADTGSDSVYAALTADTTLGGVVSAALPTETRNGGIVSWIDGRRVIQTELLISVWR